MIGFRVRFKPRVRYPIPHWVHRWKVGIVLDESGKLIVEK